MQLKFCLLFLKGGPNLTSKPELFLNVTVAVVKVVLVMKRALKK